jgi:hypothetical protein
MAKKYMKNAQILVIREMKIKKPLRFHVSQEGWLLSKKQKITNIGKNVGENKPLCVCGHANYYSCYQKKYVGPLQN